MTEDAIYPDTHMWEAFQYLNNVTKLDFACYQKSWNWEYIRQPPGTLFPSVTNLRLSGVMYRQIVESIFSSIDLSRLQCLSIDNLQDPGRSRDEYPFHVTRRAWQNT